MRKFWYIVVFAFFTTLINAQQIGVSFFYCENTLAPTFIEDITGKPIRIEMALNEKASINNLSLFGTLEAGSSFVGITSFPTNFSNNTIQYFQLTDGINMRDLQISAKKINKRNAPFTINFTERFNPSDWIKSTTGWASIGVEDTGKGIELKNDNSVFFLAYHPEQGLLSFDVSGENLTEYQGIFVVESSETGVDDWEPVFEVDNCTNTFKSDNYTINLKFDSRSQFIRFSAQNGEISMPIYLNNFKLGAYNGEIVDNFTSMNALVMDKIHLVSSFVTEKLFIAGMEDYGDVEFVIFSMEGKISKIGKVQQAEIQISGLNNGLYFIYLKTPAPKALKFIKH